MAQWKHSYLEILDKCVLSLGSLPSNMKLAAFVAGGRTPKNSEGVRGHLFIQMCLQSDTSPPYMFEELQKHCAASSKSRWFVTKPRKGWHGNIRQDHGWQFVL